MTTITPTTSRPGRWLSILVIVLGTIGVVYGIGGGVVRGFASHTATSGEFTADAEGVQQLRIDSEAAAFELRFGPVEDARLSVVSNGGPAQTWSLSRSGDTLIVDADSRWRWFGFGFGFGDGAGDELAVLTLPMELEHERLDLEAQVAAGSFQGDGDWGAVTVGLGAGSVELSGSATSLDVDVAAGEARIDIADARTVSLEVSAGRVVGQLTGEQPEAIEAQVSAGGIDLTIPDGAYAVTEQTSAGDSEVRVVDDPGAASTIDVEVSAGDVRLVGSRG